MIHDPNFTSQVFASLKRELALWEKCGQKATFWFRDDDAISMTPALARLLDLQVSFNLPMAVAVIPQRADPDLANIIRAHAGVAVLQHGWSHLNYADAGENYSEFPASRDTVEVAANLKLGKKLMDELFGPQFIQGFVPPWNNFAAEHLPSLCKHEFISARDYTIAQNYRGTPSISADVDVLRWKPLPHFRGTERLINEICRELRSRRLANRHDPVGILLHHLDMDNASWNFMHILCEFLCTHAAVKLLDIRTADLWAIAVQNIPTPQPIAKKLLNSLRQSTGQIRQLLEELLADFVLPKPAYAVAAMMALGIFTGHIYASTAAYAGDNSVLIHQMQVDTDDAP